MRFANCNSFLVALGANGGKVIADNAASLRRAQGEIDQVLGTTTLRSRLWRTPAFPADSGPDFVNACIVVESALDAESFLSGLHAIEAAMGRQRVRRWGQRVIDLDLLAMGAAMMPDRAGVEHWMNLPFEDQRSRAPDRLILPHPRLHERGFVLFPLAEVAPEWVHPVTGQTVVQMRDALDPADFAGIRPI